MTHEEQTNNTAHWLDLALEAYDEWVNSGAEINTYFEQV